MKLSDCAAEAARSFRALFSLVLSPFGYARELVWLAGALAALLGTWCLIGSALQLDDGNHHAASPRMRISISRLVHSPQRGTICALRDYQEVLAIDDHDGHEEFCRLISPAEPASFACGRDGWSLVTYSRAAGLHWWTSRWGALEIPRDDRQMVVDIEVAANGRVAAVVSRLDRVELFQLTDNGEIRPIGTSPLTDVHSIWLSPSGRKMAAKMRSGELRFLNVPDGREFRPPQRLPDLVMCADWSGDGRRFAAGLTNGAILIYDTADGGTEDRTVMAERVPASVALNADGEWLTVGSSIGRMQAFRDGELAWTREGHPGMIHAMSISQVDESEQLISAATDGKISIRSLTTGEMQRELTPKP